MPRAVILDKRFCKTAEKESFVSRFGLPGAQRTLLLSEKERDLLREAYDLPPDDDIATRNYARGIAGAFIGSGIGTAGGLALSHLVPDSKPRAKFMTALIPATIAGTLGNAFLSDKYSKTGLDDAKAIIERRKKSLREKSKHSSDEE